MDLNSVGSSQKRKKRDINLSASATNSEEESPTAKRIHSSTNDLPYCLNKINSLQKKIDQANTRKGNTIQVKGNKLNPQIVISCTPAGFEYIKSNLNVYLTKTYTTNIVNSRDQCGLIVHATNSADLPNGEPLYTINYYNTTSRILVNRTKDASIFLSHYQYLLQHLSTSGELSMNKEIADKCEKIIYQYKKSKDCTKSSYTPSQSTETDDCPDNIDRAIQITTNSSNDSRAIDTNDIESHGRLSSPVNQDSFNLQLLVRLQQLEHTVGTIPILNKTISDMKVQVQSLEDKVLKLSIENDQLKLNSTLPAQLSSSKFEQSNKKPLFSELSWPSLSHKSQKIKPFNINKNRIEFCAERCVVIDVDKDGDIVKDDDVIRELVGKSSKGVTIERINRYSTNTYKKFSVQLSTIAMVDSVIKNWPPTNFGQSTIRKTKSYIASTSSTTGVMKGVPLNISEKDISEDLTDNGFTPELVKRFCKGQKFTRAVMVRFGSVEQLERAIKRNVLSQNLSFIVSPYNTPTRSRITQCYNCLRFNHQSNGCPEDKRCFNCAEIYHGNDCQLEAKCRNCKGQHRSQSKNCDIYRFKLEVSERRYKIIEPAAAMNTAAMDSSM